LGNGGKMLRQKADESGFEFIPSFYDFGLGTERFVSDLNDTSIPTGIYRIGLHPNNPTPNNDFTVLVMNAGVEVYQQAWSSHGSNDSTWVRTYVRGWRPWRLLSHDLNSSPVIQRVVKSDNQRRLYTGSSGTWRNTYSALNTAITPKRSDSKLRVRVMLNFHGQSGSIFVRLLRNGVVDPALNGSGGSYNCFAHTRTSTTAVGNYNSSVGVLDALVTHDGSTQSFVFEHRVQRDGRFTVNRDGAPQTDSSQGAHSPTLVSTFIIEEVV